MEEAELSVPTSVDNVESCLVPGAWDVMGQKPRKATTVKEGHVSVGPPVAGISSLGG